MIEIVRRCGWLVLRLEAPWAVRSQQLALAAKYSVGGAGTDAVSQQAAIAGVFDFARTRRTRRQLPRDACAQDGTHDDGILDSILDVSLFFVLWLSNSLYLLLNDMVCCMS